MYNGEKEPNASGFIPKVPFKEYLIAKRISSKVMFG